MFTAKGTVAVGAPGAGGVDGMSSGIGWGVTGGIMPPWCPGVMGGRPGVIGTKPPAGIWAGTHTVGNAGTGTCPPPINGRVMVAGRPAPQRPQK